MFSRTPGSSKRAGTNPLAEEILAQLGEEVAYFPKRSAKTMALAALIFGDGRRRSG
jgi:hypothetical protein